MAHRKSLYPKLLTIAKQQGTDLYLVHGDMVSYQGGRWLLLDVKGPPNQAITAIIQHTTHADAVATKVVRYDTLRPLTSVREQLMYEAENDVKGGDFMFFLQGTLVVSGQVKEVGNAQLLDGTHLRPKFTTQVLHAIMAEVRQRRQKKQPNGYNPELVYVTHIGSGSGDAANSRIPNT